MANFTTVFAPLLFGLLLITGLNRAMVFWQKERTPRIFFAAITYICFCLLYLASTLEWPSVWRDAVRLVLLWALAFGNWYEWRLLFAFLHRKEDATVVPASPVTLKDLSVTGNAPVIEASEKPTIKEKGIL